LAVDRGFPASRPAPLSFDVFMLVKRGKRLSVPSPGNFASIVHV
jgi:hypothetical protein